MGIGGGGADYENELSSLVMSNCGDNVPHPSIRFGPKNNSEEGVASKSYGSVFMNEFWHHLLS